jgi:DNA repair protein RadC
MSAEGKHCPSCGGVIGLDCFNPRECMEITVSQASQYEDYVQLVPNLLAEKQRLCEVVKVQTEALKEAQSYVPVDSCETEGINAAIKAGEEILK